MSEKASIIIPMYNAAATIAKCIRSLQKQTMTDFEAIVIDDGSKDTSPSIADSLADNDSRIRIIHTANRGVSSARNRGIAEARGKFIFFVDSDDTVSPDFLKAPIAEAERTSSDIVIFGFASSFVDKKRTQTHSSRKAGILAKEEAVRGLLKDGYINNLPWNKCYRKEVFRNVTYPEGLVFEDVYTTIKLFDNAERISIIPDILYDYEVQTDSITYKWWLNERKAADYFKARMEQFSFIEENYPSLTKEAYPSAGHGALICSNHVSDDIDLKNMADDFLKNHKKELCSSAFPFGLMYRIYFMVPGLIRRFSSKLGI